MSDERAGLISSTAPNAYDEESTPTTTDDARRGGAATVTSRRRSVAASVAIAAVLVLAGTMVFLLAHDAVLAKALGLRHKSSWRRHRVTERARPAKLGEEEDKGANQPWELASAAERLVARMTVVLGTENTPIDVGS